ncbi:MAG: hypothetical protein E7281_05145 [Lachnospiraceae bacterium]|nr:hypothetical protein [Lachnospiraceae bacterium]
MNVLIIGNGFDLAHGLKTSYDDFLKICELAKAENVQWQDDKPVINERVWAENKRVLIEEISGNLGEVLWKQLCKEVRGNFWVDFLQKRENQIGKNWIDFEDEIKNFLIKIHEKQVEDKKEYMIIRADDDAGIVAFCKKYGYTNKNPRYGDVYKKLNEELNKLIKSYEIYLDGYINTCEIEQNQYLRNKTFDHVLSFNYTCTYTEHYNANVDCCYIHGKADLRYDYTNMVLGFDERSFGDDKLIPDLIPFEKFYQRVVNRTDNQYLDWIDEMEYTGTHNIYIFGHSLGVTDGDVLSKFLTADNSKVHIYYYNEQDRAEKIKNMALIIGADNVIKLTGGKDPKIVFETND